MRLQQVGLKTNGVDILRRSAASDLRLHRLLRPVSPSKQFIDQTQLIT